MLSNSTGEKLMGEMIQVKSRDGKSFAAYLALPKQASVPAAGIVLLPEVFNTNPHIRSVCDGYADDGFIVLAPDVYWRQEPDAYMTYTDEGRAKAQALRAELDTDQFATDLEDAINALRSRPDCTDKVGVMGFCLGGKFAYLSAVRHKTQAAVSYYGVQIDQHLDEAGHIKCPLLMHFAENDPHVPLPTVEQIGEALAPTGLAEIHVYSGTEHGFNRYGYPPHNEAQAAVARKRTVEHFRRNLA
jgi:carboxymethylenebutenolidase